MSLSTLTVKDEPQEAQNYMEKVTWFSLRSSVEVRLRESNSADHYNALVQKLMGHTS